jgi:hypothetical protein
VPGPLPVTTTHPLPRPFAPVAPRRRTPAGTLPHGRALVVFAAAHAVVGAAIHVAPALVNLQGVVAVLLGMWWAVFDPRLDRAVAAATYIGASDVLWRMHHTNLPYEGAKYAATFILFVVIVRHVRGVGAGPAIYLGLLLPSTAWTLLQISPGGWQDAISFNMSGPLLLFAAMAAFSAIRVGLDDLRLLVCAAVSPLLAVAAQAAYTTFSSADIYFGDDSNFATSGGFGPNQVSTVVGFGALLCLLLALRDPNRRVRIACVVTGMLMLAQSALTFSRGGVLGVGVALVVVVVVSLQERESAVRVITVAFVMAIVVVLLWSRLDAFTGGALGARFGDFGTTGRNEIAAGDIDVFLDHPVIGVGPGLVQVYREGTGHFVGQPAHTEFTRLLAEHGILGLGALAVLGLAALVRILKARSVWDRTWSAALCAWSMAAMLNAAMRVGVISLAFGMAMMAVDDARSRRV